MKLSKSINNGIEKYANFVTKKYRTIILLSIVITLIMFFGFTMIKTESMTYKKMVPTWIPTLKALNFIGDEFGQSGQSAIIIIEVDPAYDNSAEIRDVRDPKLIEYMDTLEQKIRKIDNVISVSSHTTLLKQMNNDNLPKTKSEVIELMNSELSVGNVQLNDKLKSSIFDQYVLTDYSVAVIRVSVSDMSQSETNEFIDEIKFVLQTTEEPDGVSVTANGDLFVNEAVEELIGPETGTLTMFSLIGIILLVFLIFASVRYGLISLIPIVFGTIWFFGLVGILGWSMSAELVGIISMVMGVGVDFGIQLVTRFRMELKEHEIEKAMSITIHNTFVPMITTTVAILAGFKALGFGQLTLLAKMGDMLGLGILMCFIVAMTVLPATILFLENKKKRKK